MGEDDMPLVLRAGARASGGGPVQGAVEHPARKPVFETKRSRGLRHLIDLAMVERAIKLSHPLCAKRNRRMAIFANDLIGIHINQFGVYELEELDILFDFLGPLKETFAAGTCLDIGANIGNHSLYFSPRFATVHSFEPHPATFRLLDFNVGGIGNVVAHDFGLGDSRGTFVLRENPTNLGNSSITGDSLGGAHDIEIRLECVDGLNLDLGSLCFVKIDVEGFEASVIRGAINTIRAHEPLIVLEQHEAEFVDGSTPSIAILQDLGYRFCWHHAGTLAKSTYLRRLANLRELLVGRKHRIFTGTPVPRRNHPMLIAVPARFAALVVSR
jgi:FkbM family methyltransferase